MRPRPDPRRPRAGLALSLVLALVAALAACGDSNGDGNNDGDGGSDGDGSVDGDGGTGVDANTTPGECITGVSQCTDGIDNDGDGLIDLADPECTSACDDDESSFGTGLPGDNRDPIWQDCFFDGNSGHGDDGCRYHSCCLYPTGHPSACTQQQLNQGACDVSQECINTCSPATPPGCDCFGCCTVCGVTGGCGDANGCVQIVLLPTCNFEDICSDQINCPPCQQSSQCTTQCAGGTTECTSDEQCSAAEFCVDGCCVAQIP
ncbi:MAG: hypothetical protein HS111_34975 [Kofleriaceae bacterium]|nr:hypothetical protein [Kofleriaceae bacterium]MCL4224798.1 hypothetical protein [Myxococcales bacterium]